MVSVKDGQVQEVMDEYEASAFVRVCDKSLRKLRKQKRIPFAKVGGRIVYLRSKLVAWLEAGGTSQFEVEA